MSQTSTRVSLRKLLNAHCRDCIYDPTNGGSWRKQVENCTVTVCSLYSVRPTTIKKAPNTSDQTNEQGITHG